MSDHKFMDWFQFGIAPRLLELNFELVYLNDEKDDLGTLNGVQIESDKIGGHLYYYDSGFYNIFAYDYRLDKELVPITLDNQEGDFDTLFGDFLRVFLDYPE